MAVFRVGPLPDGALEAAAAFHAKVLPEILAELGLDPPPLAGEDHLALLFPPASYDHRAWRLAVVQDLARAAAPARVNGIVGGDDDAIGGTLAYLARAPGVTGQLFEAGPT